VLRASNPVFFPVVSIFCFQVTSSGRRRCLFIFIHGYTFAQSKKQEKLFRSQTLTHDQSLVNDFLHPEFSGIGGFSAESDTRPDPRVSRYG